MKPIKIIPSFMIIVISVVVVGWIGFQIASRRTPPSDPPTRVPDPPAKVEALLGISTDCFYCSGPIIQAANGQIYTYETRYQDAAWVISQKAKGASVSDRGEEEIHKNEYSMM